MSPGKGWVQQALTLVRDAPSPADPTSAQDCWVRTRHTYGLQNRRPLEQSRINSNKNLICTEVTSFSA